MDLTAIATPPSSEVSPAPAAARTASEEEKEKKKKKKRKSKRSVIMQTDPPLQPISPSQSREGVTNDQRIVLNVGGRRFETLTSTLRKYPHSLLGTMFDPRNAALLKPDERGEVRISPLLCALPHTTSSSSIATRWCSSLSWTSTATASSSRPPPSSTRPT